MQKLILVAVFLIASNLLNAKAFRVFQIPNGSVNSCLNCHGSMGGGYPLTSFGQQVMQLGLSGDNVNWQALYDLDADGDGFTNGQELLDPNGEWSSGMADPGNATDVTKPYDADSKPLSVWSNYISKPLVTPNPSSSIFNISFSIKAPSFVDVKVIDLKGNFIAQLDNNYYPYGTINLAWNGITNIGIPAPKGTYLVVIKLANAVKVEKLILN